MLKLSQWSIYCALAACSPLCRHSGIPLPSGCMHTIPSACYIFCSDIHMDYSFTLLICHFLPEDFPSPVRKMTFDCLSSYPILTTLWLSIILSLLIFLHIQIATRYYVIYLFYCLMPLSPTSPVRGGTCQFLLMASSAHNSAWHRLDARSFLVKWMCEWQICMASIYNLYFPYI